MLMDQARLTYDKTWITPGSNHDYTDEYLYNERRTGLNTRHTGEPRRGRYCLWITLLQA